MARTGLMRLAGLSAVVGGLAATALGSLHVLQARGVSFDSTEKALQKGHYENPVATMLLVGSLSTVWFALCLLSAVSAVRLSLITL